MAGIKLTPSQVVQKWRTLPNRFEVNVLNVEGMLGGAVKHIFQESFFLQRFNTTGSTAWPSRTDNKPHALLYETGNLMMSITWRRINTTKNPGVSIYTNASTFRTSKRQYGRNFCYAGIHNGYDKKADRNNSYDGPIRQRQFMGHSTKVFDALGKFSVRLFDGFHISKHITISGIK